MRESLDSFPTIAQFICHFQTSPLFPVNIFSSQLWSSHNAFTIFSGMRKSECFCTSSSCTACINTNAQIKTIKEKLSSFVKYCLLLHLGPERPRLVIFGWKHENKAIIFKSTGKYIWEAKTLRLCCSGWLLSLTTASCVFLSAISWIWAKYRYYRLQGGIFFKLEGAWTAKRLNQSCIKNSRVKLVFVLDCHRSW